MNDILFSLRALRRSPGFAVVAVLTLALGIGANAALFSVVHAVLLRSFGYAAPERLVQIARASIPGYLAIRERAHSFDLVATSTLQMFTLLGPHEPENLYGQQVTADCFPALGAPPLMGRILAESDFRPGAPDVAILAYSVWQNSFDGDPHIIGRQILMNGTAYAVVGVMRPEFQYPHPVFRVWAPWRMAPESLANRSAHAYTLLARFKPGVTRPAAQSDLQSLAQALAREFPATDTGWRPVAAPVSEQLLGDLRPILFALLGAVGFTLLIACMNVGNLAMARGVERMREIAVRAALGASRGRIARQLLMENLLIAGAGGAVGVLFAKWWLRGLILLLPGRAIPILPGADQASIDGRVLGLATLVSLGCGVLFGLAPALRLSSTDPGRWLQEASRGSTAGLRQRRTLTGLIALETALTVILLTGAGLLLRSFSNLSRTPLGFEPEHVLTAQIPSPWSDVSQRPNAADVERRMNYLHEIVGRMQALPGVTAAGVVTTLPFGPVTVQTRIFIEGRPLPAPGEDLRLQYRAASPDYFRAMGIPLLRGRAFTDADRSGQPAVAIVNEAMARKHWPQEEAVGKRLSLGGPGGPWATVVGVISGARQELRGEPAPELYTSYVQTILGPQLSTVVLRTAQDPALLGPAVRAAIHQLNPNQPVAEIKSMGSVVAESAARPRLYAVLLAVFAALALLLAAAGIFSVISWTVNQGTREIGIRMALGATPGDVLSAAMRRALLGAGAGVLVGIGGAAALTKILAAQLYGVTATDPATFASVPLLLLAVAGLAAYLPARRATRVDPVSALR